MSKEVISDIINVEHVSVILDGNRRWARKKNLVPYLGHKAGAENLEKFIENTSNARLKYLSVYVFSTENWTRAKEEVDYLMRLFRIYFKKFLKKKDSNLKIKFFSSRENLDKEFIEMIDQIEEKTKDNTGMQLNICFNYGGRREIVEATKKIIYDVNEGNINIDDIDEDLFSNYLYSKDVPDPEIIIRTSGEMRLSNFLTWQSSYSEFFPISKTWPDFTIEDLKQILKEFEDRDRRFGGK